MSFINIICSFLVLKKSKCLRSQNLLCLQHPYFPLNILFKSRVIALTVDYEKQNETVLQIEQTMSSFQWSLKLSRLFLLELNDDVITVCANGVGNTLWCFRKWIMYSCVRNYSFISSLVVWFQPMTVLKWMIVHTSLL